MSTRATAHSTESPAVAPGPADKNPFSKIADALYNWCLENGGHGGIFSQQDLLDSSLIPSRDNAILFGATAHLVKRRLFKIHEVKGGSSLAYVLVSEEHAANYGDLVPDEQLVYGAIDNAGAAGLWSKTIRQKTGLHTKLSEKAIKSLESRGLIKQMKSVKFPSRKMFILSHLQPNEDATGGTWYTDGVLDIDMLDTMSLAIELMVGKRSWIEVKESAEGSAPTENITQLNHKRKTPADGFDIKGKGKGKASRIDDERPRSQTPEPNPSKSKPKISSKSGYEAHIAGYDGYPTATEITTELNAIKAIDTILPQTAIEQLLEVMVYDDKLEKLRRPPREYEEPEEDGLVVMFRTWKNESQIRASKRLHDKLGSSNTSKRKAAARELELEDIGIGGATEVPCMRCPVFDICGEGGPVNAETCLYFDQWFKKMDEADRETESINETEIL